MPAHAAPSRTRAALFAALLATTCGAALAEPEGPDPLGQFLADAGRPAAPARSMGDRTADVVLTAMNFLGVRYRRGGSDHASGFDCSGFTRHIVERSLGVQLPRRVDEQASAPGLVAVQREQLQPGDLVFFNTLRRTFSHVGIYVGGGKFIHSPRPGGQVRVEDLGFAYWRQRFTGARRLEPLAQAPAALRAPAGPEAAERPVTVSF